MDWQPPACHDSRLLLQLLVANSQLHRLLLLAHGSAFPQNLCMHVTHIVGTRARAACTADEEYRFCGPSLLSLTRRTAAEPGVLCAARMIVPNSPSQAWHEHIPFLNSLSCMLNANQCMLVSTCVSSLFQVGMSSPSEIVVISFQACHCLNHALPLCEYVIIHT